jgi:hypothetical protein
MRAHSRSNSACRVRADGVDATGSGIAGDVMLQIMAVILGLAGPPVQAPSGL